MITIIKHTETEKAKAYKLGGKASNLFQLNKLGANVPPWLVIPADVIINKLNETKQTFSSPDDYIKAIDSFMISEEDIDVIISNFDSEENTYFAVRSSAIDEDGDEYSFAGQFDTFLYVNKEHLADKIKDVWKSAFSKRVLEYRKQNKLKQEAGIAVIIQKMINADKSGVAFGVDPVSGNSDTKVISAVFGLGEGLVSGELNADTFKLNGKAITNDIVDKTHSIVFDKDSESLQKVNTEKSKRNNSTLNEQEILIISDLLDKLNKELGKPQDIEFAFEGDEFFMLQTRPISTISKLNREEYILWDNSNIIESYPGVTTPLTYSFITKMYEAVYKQLVALLGVKEKEIKQHSHIFENTLGLVRGRVYYNLLSWYKMLAMMPGYSLNAEFMETMMGVKEKFELEEEFQMSRGLARRRIIAMVFKMIWLQMRLPNERRQFIKHLNKVISRYKLIDFDHLSIKEIKDYYLEFETTLLKKWKAPLINDFFSMIWFGLLKKLSEKYSSGNHSNLHNDLLCGSNDIISTEPIHRSLNIADLINKDDSLKELFISKSEKEILQNLKHKNYSEVQKEIDNYLDVFGERCIGELKLETISYAQKPELFIKLLKSYTEHGLSDFAGTSNIETELRDNAWRIIKKELKGKPIKRALFKFVLNKARDLVSNRENLRYERTRGFGMVRKMFTAIGKQLKQNKLIEQTQDIFLLELHELIDYAEGKLKADIKVLISERKVEFENYKKQNNPAERFYTYGHNFTDAYIYSDEKLEAKKTELQGIGACPGKVKAKVQVVSDPNETNHMHGNILVTSNTDPGWVKLFPTVSGIIVERGSLLSHSAIVSREMGIPCIVGVSGLLRSVENGDEILMDGSTGKLIILENGQTT